MDASREPTLPSYLGEAWGLRERPNKGPKRGLSLQRIVDAAVAIAASEGLSAVSMSRVAADLGASTMALYRYLASKDELLVLMMDAIYQTPPSPPQTPDEGWRAGLSRWAWEQHTILRKHTWALRIPITGPPVTPNQIIWLERGLHCLGDTPLSEGDKLSVIMLLSGYTRSEATVSADVEATFMAKAPDELAAMVSYGQLVRRLVGPDRFPALNKVIDAGVLDEPAGPDDEFVFGLERILDGIGVLIDQPRD
ncbi:TetR/AcrR family transcriptional regulator [Streptomyces luteolifulvus]|jgi:AcrR family transcriptional regulator|uniref:TetR/AcrR family transcriptional regulator n=1 Tax=Streptomyces luteolifulvus TaxID=2615112 RepID=A0A6H9V011_9ACTN|nr:TetR/AcrR family transcriptional regulator [Streptomyces luteolifulvus]KAB1145074.1 TetR/AcrR family transcriptional regulator [Streptomyces luteolifulvus]